VTGSHNCVADALWIVDSSPLVLGALGYAIGWLTANLAALAEDLEHQVADRTARLEEALASAKLDSKRASAAERRARRLIQCTPMGIAAWDSRGRVTMCNREFARLTDRTVGDLGRDEFIHHVHPDDRDAIADLIVSTTDRSCAVPVEVRLPLAGDSVRTLRVFAVRWADERHRPGVLVLAEDVTEQRAAERDRDEAERRAQRAEKLEAIGQLAAGIAHEINTPTQYVSDNVAFLGQAFDRVLAPLETCKELVAAAADGAPDAALVRRAKRALAKAKLPFITKQVPRAITQSLEGLERVATIVAAMKEFSHPSAGIKEPVDLARLIDTTVTVARNEWKYAADVEVDHDDALGPVQCLRDELSQVVLNLVVNAAHAVSEATGDGQRGKGTIRIASRRDGDWAEVTVTDTGCGIPPQSLDKIFEPFFTTKPVGKGTGQGLAIAHDIVVNKHGGTIDVRSEVGVGSTFVIRIPLVADDADRVQATTASNDGEEAAA